MTNEERTEYKIDNKSTIKIVMHLLMRNGYCILVSKYLVHILMKTQSVFWFFCSFYSQMFFRPIEVLNVEFV